MDGPQRALPALWSRFLQAAHGHSQSCRVALSCSFHGPCVLRGTKPFGVFLYVHSILHLLAASQQGSFLSAPVSEGLSFQLGKCVLLSAKIFSHVKVGHAHILVCAGRSAPPRFSCCETFASWWYLDLEVSSGSSFPDACTLSENHTSGPAVSPAAAGSGQDAILAAGGEVPALSFCLAACPAQPSAGLGQSHICSTYLYIFPPLASRRNQFHSPKQRQRP